MYNDKVEFDDSYETYIIEQTQQKQFLYQISQE